MLTPYWDNGQQQRKYNFYQSSNRVVIEHAFALLKSRFRRLHMFDTALVSTAVDIIMASCILHNLCILEGDILDENEVQADADRVANVKVFQDDNAEGVFKRDIMTGNLV